MATGEGNHEDVKAHHQQSKFCYGRPSYRSARWERAVKVYTVNQESRYLIIQGVPAVGASKELIEMFAIYGAIDEYRILDEYPTEEFTEAYWIKFLKIASARYAKRKVDNRSFMGGILHVCYAPEYESLQDTRDKVLDRMRSIAKKLNEGQSSSSNIQKLTPRQQTHENVSSTGSNQRTNTTIIRPGKRKRESDELACSSSQFVSVPKSAIEMLPDPPAVNGIERKTVKCNQARSKSSDSSCVTPVASASGSYETTISNIRRKLKNVAEGPPPSTNRSKSKRRRI